MAPEAGASAAALARLVAPDALDDLLLLLAFRHFFRHAYAVTFIATRLLEELDRLDRAAPRVEVGLDAFEGFAEDALKALTRE